MGDGIALIPSILVVLSEKGPHLRRAQSNTAIFVATDANAMEFIKRLLGYHKTPPVLVDACLFELNCVIMQVVPKHGRRVGGIDSF